MVIVQAWQQGAATGVDDAVVFLPRETSTDSGDYVSLYANIGDIGMAEQPGIFNQGSDVIPRRAVVGAGP